MKYAVVLLAVLCFSCISYPQVPPNSDGLEPLPEYFAVEKLPPAEDDEVLVEVEVGALRQALYEKAAYHALLDVVNTRGTRIESLAYERGVLIESMDESQKIGKINTVLGIGSGLFAGFVVGFMTFSLMNMTR